MEPILGGLMIFALRIGDVSLGTLRTMFTVQGRKGLAPMIGFFESLIWVLAISRIFTQLNNPYNIAGYATGFATGTWVGILLEQKLAIGFLQIYIISRHHADAITNELRRCGFGVTLIPGEGGSGGQSIISSMIRRSKMKEFRGIVNTFDPQAFISIQNAVHYNGYVHGARK